MAKRGALTHRKTRRLARLLGGIPLPCALGVAESLWHATQAHAPDGAIGQLSDCSIAEEMWWDGDPAQLVEALVESGFVDRHEEHRLVVHGWAEHADAGVHMALARKRAFFASGEIPNFGRLPPHERREAEQFYAGSVVRTESQSVRTEPESVRTPCARQAHAVRESPPRPAPPIENPPTQNAREGASAVDLEAVADPSDLGEGADVPQEPRNATQEPRPGLVHLTPGIVVQVPLDGPLPEDWKPLPRQVQFLRDLGHDPDDVVAEFIAHARDKARRSADWIAAFDRWSRKEQVYAAQRRNTGIARAAPADPVAAIEATRKRHQDEIEAVAARAEARRREREQQGGRP